MFSAYEFTFDGKSSLMYGLMLCDIDGKGQSDVSFGNVGSIVESKTNRRVQPIHFGVKYNTSPLQFKLVFGSDRPLDRFEFESVSLWLTGHQDYKWLSIDQPDMEHLQFKCIITQITPITVAWVPYAFEATVRCDCPYAYGFPFKERYTINSKTNILFRNESSVREHIKPTITFVPFSGTNRLSIVNKDDGGRVFLLDNLPASGLNIVVDNKNGIITETTEGYNLYDGFNLNFFRLIQGDNNLEIQGDGVLTISGRFLYNVAG